MSKHTCCHCRKTFINLGSLDRHRIKTGGVTKKCSVNPVYFSVLQDGSYSHRGYGMQLKETPTTEIPTTTTLKSETYL